MMPLWRTESIYNHLPETSVTISRLVLKGTKFSNISINNKLFPHLELLRNPGHRSDEKLMQTDPWQLEQDLGSRPQTLLQRFIEFPLLTMSSVSFASSTDKRYTLHLLGVYLARASMLVMLVIINISFKTHRH